MRDHIELVVPGISAFDTIGNSSEFISYSDFILLGSLKLAVHSHKAIFAQRPDTSNNLSFMLPIAGTVEYTVNRKAHVSREKTTGVFLSGAARTAHTSDVSQVMMSLNQDRLLRVAESMSGKPGGKFSLNLSEDRLLPLQQGGQDYYAVFQQLFSVIDSASGNVQILKMMAIEDVFERVICMMLNPGLILKDTADSDRSASHKKLTLLCEWIEAHLENPLNLTCLEELSGLSARSLQTLFQQHYQCTPMQWVKARRLNAAYQQLANPQPTTSVTSVALGYGFNHLSHFSKDYRQRYAEAPGETLLKANKQLFR